VKPIYKVLQGKKKRNKKNWLLVFNPSEKYARQNGFIFPKFSGRKFQKKMESTS